MGKLTDIGIKGWIKTGERFEQRSDGAGLYLRYRENDAAPVWLFRYRFAGKARIVVMGRYDTMPLAKARKEAVLLAARVKLGHDVAGEKRARKLDALEAIAVEKRKRTVAMVADDFYTQVIDGRWKRDHVVRQRIEKDILPAIGKMEVGTVRPADIDVMLRRVRKRGAPAIANDVLRWSKRIFNFAVKRGLCEFNPAAAFDTSDAGGKMKARDRVLSRSELVAVFAAMQATPSFGRENELAVMLLLLTCVRKNELLQAQWSEFDLDAGVWHLPKARSKTDESISIPLSGWAIELLKEAHTLACGSDYVFPARKAQNRQLPHVSENALLEAFRRLKPNLQGVPHFTVHDLRRTARTQLAELGVAPHVAEKCLNHSLGGILRVYDTHDYFAERKAALAKWADLLKKLAAGGADVIPLHEKKVAGAAA